MNFRSIATRACLLAVLAGLSGSLVERISLIVSEDRNRDGRADVWRYYDGRGALSTVLHDRNFDGYVDAREGFHSNRLVSRVVDQDFDHRFDPTLGVSVADGPDLTFNLESQPFLLPHGAIIDNHRIDDRAPAPLDRAARRGVSGNTTDRAPPSSSF